MEASRADGSLFSSFIYYDEEAIITGSSDTTLYRRLTLALDLPPLLIGTRTFAAFPGCNKLFKTCVEKFKNSQNFGGFPWMPTVNARDLLLGQIPPSTEVT